MYDQRHVTGVDTATAESDHESARRSIRASEDEASNIALTTSHVSSRRNEAQGAELDGMAEQFERPDPLDNAEKITGAEAASKQGNESRLRNYTKAVLWFMQDQWFILALVPLIVIASQVQVPASGQQAKETAVTYVSVSVIFFITGCTLPTRVLIENYSRWKIHLFVQLQCFLVASAITYGIVSACATNPSFMDPFLLIGIIFMGSLPTTIASNVVMTRQAHGNTSLTVVESTIGNFLAPFLTPALVSMYTSSTGAYYAMVLPTDSGGYGEVYKRIFKQLGLSVFVPMFAGQIFRNLFPKVVQKVFVDWKFSKLGSFSLLAIIWSTYDQAFETGAFTSVKGDNMVFVVFVSVAVFLVLLTVCFLTSLPWLPKKDTIAVCYCVPAKTPAMGIPITSVMYLGLTRQQSSKIQIPMVIYQGLQLLFSSLLTIVFRRWIQQEEEEVARKTQENNVEKM